MRIRLGAALLAAISVTLPACGSGSGTPAPSPTPSCTPVVSTKGLDLNTPGTLTVGSDIAYAPQEYYDKQTPTGFDLDLGRALADKLCLGFRAVNQDFTTIIPALNNGNLDVIMSAMTITPQRSQQVYFIPYFEAGEQFVVKAGGAHHPTKLTDLCGLRVAVEQGTSEADELTNSITPACGSNPPTKLQFDTDPEALEALLQDKADVEFTDSPVAEYDVKNTKGLEISSIVLETAPEGIAIRKTDVGMQAAIAKAFQALQTDGTYQRLLAKWGLEAGALPAATSPASAAPTPSPAG